MSTNDGDDRGAIGSAAVVVAGLLVASAVLAGVAFNLTAPSGEAILDDTSERYDSAETIAGSAVVTVSNDTRTETYDATFAATDDNESRVSVTGPNGTTVVGTNGTVAWVHDPDTGLTRVYDEDGADPSELNKSQNETLRDKGESVRSLLFDWTEENTTATRDGSTTIDGTEAWIVTVEPTNESRDGTLTYWIAQESSTVLKQEYTDDDGTVTVRYTETRFDVSLANSTFQPPGAVTDRTERVETFDALQSATTITVPALGDGYTFTEGAVTDYGGETAAASYEGQANVTIVTSLAEEVPVETGDATQVDLGGVTANVTSEDGRTVVVWQENGVTVAVVTDADRDTALALAERIVDSADDGADERLTPRALA